MGAALPTVFDALGRGMSLVGGGLGGVFQLFASLLEFRFDAFGGFGDFVAGAVRCVALIGVGLVVAEKSTSCKIQDAANRKNSQRAWRHFRLLIVRLGDLRGRHWI